jgi:hypothetical protein
MDEWKMEKNKKFQSDTVVSLRRIAEAFGRLVGVAIHILICQHCSLVIHRYVGSSLCVNGS